ncbi:MAG: hypothetical protein LC676_18320 [Loktanella sp.]|nr:hypothetical protein [Loktanella sp.]
MATTKPTLFYRFSANHCDWKNTCEATSKKHLGGKGAALVAMSQAGIPVPPGFTLGTALCNQYRGMKTDPEAAAGFLDSIVDNAFYHYHCLSDHIGYIPLISVRSGAAISMPGMMDTILNVGLSDLDLPEWTERIGERAALDSYRRLIQMLGATAFGVPAAEFEAELAKWKTKEAVATDAELSVPIMKEVLSGFHAIFEHHTGHSFPQDACKQLHAAIKAVFDSWDNPRAVHYRKINGIDDNMGTAVTVQAMVFGNTGDTSGSGVLFTRNPSNGQNMIMGEYLPNAQGEDVVAGTRTPYGLDQVYKDLSPVWATQLTEICDKLEVTYRDMVDVEFTVQDNTLYILQSRSGKRSAHAAFKIAVDLFDQGVITMEEVLSRLTGNQFKTVNNPAVDPEFDIKPHLTGLPACPGLVTGRPVFSTAEAVKATDPVILVTHETTPDDIEGMSAARGILTQTGGATSHAAVVARAMDKPCITGCTGLDLNLLQSKSVKAALHSITIDGATGNVWLDTDVPVVDGASTPEVLRVVHECLKRSDLHVSVPVFDADAQAARQVIRASEWWGHNQVLDMTIEELNGLESRKGLVLDLRSPNSFTPEVDRQVLSMFGDGFGAKMLKDNAFQKRLIKRLVDYNKSLTGLTLIQDGPGDPAQASLMPMFTMVDDVPAAPVEYVVFQELA